MRDTIFFTLTISVLIAAVLVNLMVIRLKIDEPPIIGAARRLRVGAFLVVISSASYQALQYPLPKLLLQTDYYLAISLVLIGVSDIFIAVSKLTGMIQWMSPEPSQPINVFPVQQPKSAEVISYGSILPTDRKQD